MNWQAASRAFALVLKWEMVVCGAAVVGYVFWNEQKRRRHRLWALVLPLALPMLAWLVAGIGLRVTVGG